MNQDDDPTPTRSSPHSPPTSTAPPAPTHPAQPNRVTQDLPRSLERPTWSMTPSPKHLTTHQATPLGNPPGIQVTPNRSKQIPQQTRPSTGPTTTRSPSNGTDSQGHRVRPPLRRHRGNRRRYRTSCQPRSRSTSHTVAEHLTPRTNLRRLTTPQRNTHRHHPAHHPTKHSPLRPQPRPNSGRLHPLTSTVSSPPTPQC